MAVSVENVKCLKETEAAILVEIEGEQHWIPQSCVTDASEVWKEGDEGTLVITDWIAQQKGIE
jgi:hypothetical protein